MSKRKNKNKWIDDFGEFIPGSFKYHGATSLEEFTKMSEAEQRLKAKREVIWPLIDAEALIKKGADTFVVFMQTKLRRMVYAIPKFHNDDFTERATEYVAALISYKNAVMALKTENDIIEFARTAKKHKEWEACVSIYKVSGVQWNIKSYERKFADSDFPRNKRKSSKRKKAFKLPPLATIERGGEDYRKGKNSNEKRWENKFGFRGVVFGNSVPQKERQDDLNCGEDGFTDLAVALDISNSDVSLNGKLSVSFAARGRGHAGGHYETLQKIMNLTRTSGAGTVAKLWFYALDDCLAEFCGITSGHFASEATDEEIEKLPASFNLLINSLKYDVDGNETNFYKGSQDFDKHFRKLSYGGWDSNAEMASRAFACYVKDALGYKSDYLVAHADSYEFEYENKCLCAIPQGEERELFDELFEQLFYDLKDMGFFNDRPIELPKDVKKKEEKKVVENKSDDNHLTPISTTPTGQLRFVL
jgi:hypothetical protein